MKKYNNLLLADCSVCGKRICECSCSNSHLKKRFVHKIIKLFRYNSKDKTGINNLIFNLKHENRDDVVEFLADELFNAFKSSNIKTENLIITNVPRRKRSIKKYGYDHAAVLAKALAKRLGIEYVPLLKSLAKSDQKEKRGREERMKNADFDYRNKTPDITGKNVIILDDIITTGASMGSCAMLIHGLGAKNIIGCAVGIAYTDDYIPFQYVKWKR